MNGFIKFLSEKATKETKNGIKVLAELKRGINKSPYECSLVTKNIINFIPENCSKIEENAYFITTSLFAIYPNHSYEIKSIGDSFRRFINQNYKNNDQVETKEKYFVKLLNSNSNDLQFVLKKIIKLISSSSVPINYEILLNSIIYWDIENKNIKKALARDFWNYKNKESGEK